MAAVLSIGPFTFDSSGLAPDPLEGSGCNQTNDQEVPPAKAGRILPGITLFVCPLERDVEDRPFVGFLLPDTGAHRAVPNFVDRLLIGSSC